MNRTTTVSILARLVVAGVALTLTFPQAARSDTDPSDTPVTLVANGTAVEVLILLSQAANVPIVWPGEDWLRGWAVSIDGTQTHTVGSVLDAIGVAWHWQGDLLVVTGRRVEPWEAGFRPPAVEPPVAAGWQPWDGVLLPPELAGRPVIYEGVQPADNGRVIKGTLRSFVASLKESGVDITLDPSVPASVADGTVAVPFSPVPAITAQDVLRQLVITADARGLDFAVFVFRKTDDRAGEQTLRIVPRAKGGSPGQPRSSTAERPSASTLATEPDEKPVLQGPGVWHMVFPGWKGGEPVGRAEPGLILTSRPAPDATEATITYELMNASLLNVLRVFSEKLGLPFALDPDVHADSSVTASFKDTPVLGALDTVLRAVGLHGQSEARPDFHGLRISRSAVGHTFAGGAFAGGGGLSGGPSLGGGYWGAAGLRYGLLQSRLLGPYGRMSTDDLRALLPPEVADAKIDLAFTDADLQHVIRALAKAGSLPVVLGDGVKRDTRITCDLRAKTPADALAMILAMTGLYAQVEVGREGLAGLTIVSEPGWTSAPDALDIRVAQLEAAMRAVGKLLPPEIAQRHVVSATSYRDLRQAFRSLADALGIEIVVADTVPPVQTPSGEAPDQTVASVLARFLLSANLRAEARKDDQGRFAGLTILPAAPAGVSQATTAAAPATCPRDHTPLQPGWHFCPKCGEPIPGPQPDWKFCPFCGKPVEEKAP